LRRWGVPDQTRPRNPMFVFDEALCDLVLDYCRERLALDPVPLDFGGAQASSLAASLEGVINPGGTGVEEILELFRDQLARAVISCDSTRFLSFIPAAPTKASLLFDMIVACSSLQGTSWMEAAGAVAAENQALDVLASLAGLPAGAGGCFVSGGSAGNLSGLMVGRDTAAYRLGDRTPESPLIAISEEAHSSVGKALRVLGVDPLVVPCDDHRMTGRGLEETLRSHPRGPDVIAVVATAGTTNAGVIDDLAGIADIAEERALWFHVDGAYGCAALFAPSARHRFAGMERADSFVVDPHKWLFGPFDCAALIYRQPNLAKAVHTQDASYLDVIHRGVPEEWNPSDYAYHLTRRARGLPLWFSLALHGTDAYRDAVETVLSVARESAELIERTPYLELVRPPELSIVLFRRTGWAREDYDEWSDRLLRDQIGFVTATTWEGAPVARFAFLHPETSPEIVEEILSTMA
jgi:aromatic-L-amino-acid/L-tryptophan decarboxylase